MIVKFKSHKLMQFTGTLRIVQFFILIVCPAQDISFWPAGTLHVVKQYFDFIGLYIRIR